ncbi:protein FAM163A [Pygocentrus nattereri]|uniref:Family with sequence similarity 163 member A n=1 Tax=Pygocentrus nattereri TaxID=42514 RepID=A0AAR2JZI5_PYGNA|nr:protein FAM163A [Pygocentrus nattereri]
MTAGTVVITGGILATVILLCIIAVLCYCRLQYYCCKRNGSEVDSGLAGDPQPQFACNACSAPGVDGAAVTPLVLPFDPTLPFDPAAAHGYCPTCTPHHLRDSVRNGGERLLGFMPGHYENTHATALGMAALLSRRSPPDFITNTHAISTDV